MLNRAARDTFNSKSADGNDNPKRRGDGEIYILLSHRQKSMCISDNFTEIVFEICYIHIIYF